LDAAAVSLADVPPPEEADRSSSPAPAPCASSCCGSSHGAGNEALLESGLGTAAAEASLPVRALTALFSWLGILRLANTLRGSVVGAGLCWLMLAAAGVAHVCAPGLAGGAAVASMARNAAVVLVYALAGTPAFVDMCFEIAAGKLNIHVLTTAAVLGTVVLGCALEGALLLTLFATAHLVEERLTHEAQGNLQVLWASVPKRAQLVNMRQEAPGGKLVPDMESVHVVEAESVPLGSHAIVKTGEQVPIDGEVVYGSAMCSLEHITGESIPVKRGVGDEVAAGAMNCNGVLVVRTTCTSAESTPARIARLTAEAQSRRPKLQHMLDRLGGQYSRAVLAVTFAMILIGPFTGLPIAGAGGSTYRAFAFLASAAPCALLMAPLAYVTAIGSCAKKGVLVRGGLTLDALANVKTVAFDKTGTLTQGNIDCVSVQTLAGSAEARREGGDAEVWKPSERPVELAVAAAMESRTSHPIARAVLKAAGTDGANDDGDDDDDDDDERGGASDGNGAATSPAVAGTCTTTLPEVCVDNFEVIHGRGVTATVRVNGDAAPVQARFGSFAFASEALPPAQAERLLSMGEEGPSTPDRASIKSALVMDGKVSIFRFTDTVRDTSKAALLALEKQGMEVCMLTGDNAPAAAAVASQLGMPASAVHAELKPAEKLGMVENLRYDKVNDVEGGVMMVGDGINDAPALAAADVGVAIASRPTEAAAAAADVLLLHKDSTGISVLPDLFKLAQHTRRIIRQNLALAVVSIIGAALPALFGVFPLWLAVLLHEGSTLLVALNSCRLLLYASAGGYPKGMVRMAVTTGLVMLTGVAAVALLMQAQQGWFLQATRTGLLAGLLHTLTGPDHLAALAPLTIGRPRMTSMALGGVWGLGHNTGNLVIGAIFVLLRDQLPIPMDMLSKWGQALVGLTLLLIGSIGVREALEMEVGEDAQSKEAAEKKRKLAAEEKPKFGLGTFFTGVIHGCQPDSLLVLIPALALDRVHAIAYLVWFSIGTVIAMSVYTGCISAGTSAISRDNPQSIRLISVLSSAVALALGGFLCVTCGSAA